MVANVNTYNGLLSAIQAWTNRTDTVFINNIPLFISLAEQEFYIDCPNLGTQNYATGNFTIDNGVIPKPALWGQTLTFSFLDENDNVNILNRVSYEFIREFNPQPSVPIVSSPVPLYYSDEGYNYILITPTPTVAYKFELVYYTKITPLSPTQQSNWITQYAYDALLWLCLGKAFRFIDNHAEADKYLSLGQERMQAIKQYNQGRNFDRSANVSKE